MFVGNLAVSFATSKSAVLMESKMSNLVSLWKGQPNFGFKILVIIYPQPQLNTLKRPSYCIFEGSKTRQRKGQLATKMSMQQQKVSSTENNVISGQIKKIEKRP